MKSNRIILLLVLLVVFGGLAAWWLSRPGDAPRINQEFDPGVGAGRESGDPLRADIKQPEPKTNQPEQAAPDETPPEEEPPAEGESSTPAIEETETPITPVYAPGILRGRASARFELLDSNHQPLYRPSVETSLYRRVGMRWMYHASTWDPEQRCVICNGNFNEGLEPGEYELEINAGDYGFLLHKFSLHGGQQLEAPLNLQNYRRIVMFRFKTPEGAPVDWIDNYPTVEVQTPRPEAIQRLTAPGFVLRSPPTPGSNSAVGLGGGRGGKGGFAYRRDAMMATDDGRVYVPVMAGAQNVVTFKMKSSIWGLGELEYKGEFLEDQWSDYVVELPVAGDFDTLTAEYHRWSLDDPGRRSYLNWVVDYLTPKAFDVESAIPLASKVRLIVECDPPTGAHMNCGSNQHGKELTEVSFAMERQGKFFYTDTEPGTVLYYGLYIDGQRLGPLSKHTIGEQRIQRLKYEVPAVRVTAGPGSMSPTVDQWMIHSRLEVEIRQKNEKDNIIRTECKLDLRDGGYWLGNDIAGLLGDCYEMRYRYEISEKFAKPWRSYSGYNSDPVHHWRGACGGIAEGDVARGLLTGKFDPGKPTRGIALRAVSGGEALPWVHCSVVSWKQDEMCRRLREIESELAKDDKRPSLGRKFAERFKWEEEALTEEGIEPERMEEFMGEDFVERAEGKPELAWYARNGAWYDTHRKLATDKCGYAVDFEMELTPGELYVLYAWSNSRDDLRPDARIVFRATEGLTDLGAISLPTYTE